LTIATQAKGASAENPINLEDWKENDGVALQGQSQTLTHDEKPQDDDSECEILSVSRGPRRPRPRPRPSARKRDVGERSSYQVGEKVNKSQASPSQQVSRASTSQATIDDVMTQQDTECTFSVLEDLNNCDFDFAEADGLEGSSTQADLTDAGEAQRNDTHTFNTTADNVHIVETQDEEVYELDSSSQPDQLDDKISHGDDLGRLEETNVESLITETQADSGLEPSAHDDSVDAEVLQVEGFGQLESGAETPFEESADAVESDSPPARIDADVSPVEGHVQQETGAIWNQSIEWQSEDEIDELQSSSEADIVSNGVIQVNDFTELTEAIDGDGVSEVAITGDTDATETMLKDTVVDNIADEDAETQEHSQESSEIATENDDALQDDLSSIIAATIENEISWIEEQVQTTIKLDPDSLGQQSSFAPETLLPENCTMPLQLHDVVEYPTTTQAEWDHLMMYHAHPSLHQVGRYQSRSPSPSDSVTICGDEEEDEDGLDDEEIETDGDERPASLAAVRERTASNASAASSLSRTDSLFDGSNRSSMTPPTDSGPSQRYDEAVPLQMDKKRRGINAYMSSRGETAQQKRVRH
jgi:hypothetical protein